MPRAKMRGGAGTGNVRFVRSERGVGEMGRCSVEGNASEVEDGVLSIQRLLGRDGGQGR